VRYHPIATFRMDGIVPCLGFLQLFLFSQLVLFKKRLKLFRSSQCKKETIRGRNRNDSKWVLLSINGFWADNGYLPVIF
jgi:hypothetical protein